MINAQVDIIRCTTGQLHLFNQDNSRKLALYHTCATLIEIQIMISQQYINVSNLFIDSFYLIINLKVGKDNYIYVFIKYKCVLGPCPTCATLVEIQIMIYTISTFVYQLSNLFVLIYFII